VITIILVLVHKLDCGRVEDDELCESGVKGKTVVLHCTDLKCQGMV